jgi:hypothetical protein
MRQLDDSGGGYFVALKGQFSSVSLLLLYGNSSYIWEWKSNYQHSILVETPRKNNPLCVHGRPLNCTYSTF